jgi:hypothetical protein
MHAAIRRSADRAAKSQDSDRECEAGAGGALAKR